MTLWWNIFWRTFAQLTLAVLIAAKLLEWSPATFKTSAVVVFWGLVGAFIGGVIAVLTAFARTAATTALQKAIRSAVQALVGVLSLVVVNSLDTFMQLQNLLIMGAGGIVLAFAITFFQYQDAPTTGEPTPLT